ncbi:hypothetical protein LCGC14_0248550 [marine sediment metagenome]|uniref:Uncharacterized protein n=1 Tax=marine sediment metagenome TaxID=412755 RepID=A0A0F9X9M7_9ZZZZ
MVSRKQKKKDRKRVSAKRRREEHQSGFTGTSIKLPEDTTFFQIEKAGVRRFDVVPYEVGEDAGNPHADSGEKYFERTFYTHRIGAESKPYICPLKTFKRPCPVCVERGKLAQDPDNSKELISALLPKERQLWNVFDRENPEEGVQIWDYSYHLFGKQLDAKLDHADEEDEYDYFADPEDGFTLKVGFSKKSGGGYNWNEATDIEFKNRKEPLSKEIIDAAHDLDSLLVVESYDILKKVFFEMGDDDDGDGDEEEDEKEKPPKEKKRRSKKEKKKETMTAEEAGLEVGDEVTHKEHEEWGTCDITKISGDDTPITIEDEDGEEHRAIGVEDLEKVEDDPEPNPEPEPEKKKGRGKKGKGKDKKEKKPDPVDDDADGDVDDQDIDEAEENWDDDDDEDWDEDDD